LTKRKNKHYIIDMELELLGIKPNKKKQFEAKGIFSVEDILQYLPRTYKDFRKLTGILPREQISLVSAAVVSCERRPGNGKQFVTASCVIEPLNQQLTVRWFNMHWIYSSIKLLADKRARVIIAGKIDFNDKYGYSLNQPDIFEPVSNQTLRIYPVYPAIAGMASSYLEDTMQKAIALGIADSEILPRDVVDASGETSMPVALRYIHMPRTMEEVEKGRSRILFNDLLYYAIHNELNRSEVSAGSQYNIKSRSLLNKIIDSLPFKLTPDQSKTVQEMLESAEDGRRINALVQGDVGCGKTIICVLMAAAFADSGYQAVIMAPTQVLAKQHYESINELLAPYGVRTAFLDSSLRKKDRDSVLKAIASGNAQVIIGTHSCVGKDVAFKDLALAVVDEEHRFGVKQRTAIVEKASRGVHSITMSATPIPRSLAQVVFGENIQLHTIRSMPKGRQPVKTRVFRNQTGNMKFILKEVQAGHQAYVVCPMIESNEKVPGVKSVEQVSREYNDFLGPAGVQIATLTGKTSKEETEEIIEKFRRGDLDLLIATTVIEVGVNVPNATVMVITNAERFGLSSLHQLRGRVGRSDLQSYCVLQSEDETPKGLARLQVMCDTTDGFKIAEADLDQRGAGDLLGTQQSGDNKYVSLMIANPEKYQHALKVARELIQRGKDCCPLMESIMAERSQSV